MSVDQPQTPEQTEATHPDAQTSVEAEATQPDAPQAPEPSGPPETPAASSEPSEADLKAQLEDMRRRFSDLEGRLSSGQLSATPQDDQLRQKVSQLREEYADWPKKGDEGKDMPQPWDLKEHGIPRPGV